MNGITGMVQIWGHARYTLIISHTWLAFKKFKGIWSVYIMGPMLRDQLNTIHSFSTANIHFPGLLPPISPPQLLHHNSLKPMQHLGGAAGRVQLIPPPPPPTHTLSLLQAGWWSVKRIIKTQFVTVTRTHTLPGEGYPSPGAHSSTQRKGGKKGCRGLLLACLTSDLQDACAWTWPHNMSTHSERKQ